MKATPFILSVVARSWLRRDVHRAATVRGGVPLWSSGDLEMALHDGRTVTIGDSGGELVRRVRARDGAMAQRRVLLRGVRWWRWRSRSPGLLEIDLAVVRVAGLDRPQRPGPGWRDAAVGLQRERIVLSLRGAPGGRRW